MNLKKENRCFNQLCLSWDENFRCKCKKAVKGKIEVLTCKIRQRSLIVSKKKSISKWRQKNKKWWNGYQRAYHNLLKPVPRFMGITSVIGRTFGKQIQVKCPFCKGKHRHLKGQAIKFAQCGNGYYKIKMKDK
jgi:hypothetical protein